MDKAGVFPYPVGILLFNRPQLSKLLLKQILRSSIRIEPENLFFIIDGFLGSKAELEGEKDYTRKNIAQVERFFPDAHLTILDENIGIYPSYLRLMAQTFSQAHDFAVFFEEDVFPSEKYFENLLPLLLNFASETRLAKISISSRDSIQLNIAGAGEVFPTFGTREFAMKRTAYEAEKRDLLQLLNPFNANQPQWASTELDKHFGDNEYVYGDYRHLLVDKKNRYIHLRFPSPFVFEAVHVSGNSDAGRSTLELLSSALNLYGLKVFRNFTDVSKPIWEMETLVQKNLDFLEFETYINHGFDLFWTNFKAQRKRSTLKVGESRRNLIDKFIELRLVKKVLSKVRRQCETAISEKCLKILETNQRPREQVSIPI